MSEGGFLKGTSLEQDVRFKDKQKKLLKSMKFPPEYSTKVDMKKVELAVMKPWIETRVQELLQLDDEILIAYLFSLLEAETVDPRIVQINMTEFLGGGDASTLVLEIWKMLISAQNNMGVPKELMEAKRAEIEKQREETQRIAAELSKIKEKVKIIENTLTDPVTDYNEQSGKKKSKKSNRKRGNWKRTEEEKIEGETMTEEETTGEMIEEETIEGSRGEKRKESDSSISEREEKKNKASPSGSPAASPREVKEEKRETESATTEASRE
ncbi:hypothetical protein PROFUN_02888 [Planoprotostelium fungivorum]|uniref:PWI domain-containing protein n=1 Tax=Planoprotostelium fungivorum TaxID=1890364 RepID=A0A2P6NRZ7_9EUKA|nr:hypothetical protein PROFUN_02888 [Planoprotostelium fungivorum]